MASNLSPMSTACGRLELETQELLRVAYIGRISHSGIARI